MYLALGSKYAPVIAEHGAIDDNFLEQFDKLIGEVSGHKCFDGDRDVLRVLGLCQGRLHHLVDQWPPELVLVVQHLSPQIHVAPADQITSLGLEKRQVGSKILSP